MDALVIDLDVGMPIEEFSHCFTGECRVNVLPILYKLNQVISVSADLAEPLRIILDIMQRNLKMVRGVITLYDRRSETIFIHESFGLTERRRSAASMRWARASRGRSSKAVR